MFQAYFIKQALKVLITTLGPKFQLSAMISEWEKVEDITPKEVADKALDWVENHVLESASTMDDHLVLPICDMIRLTFDIPDDDVPDDTSSE